MLRSWDGVLLSHVARSWMDNKDEYVPAITQLHRGDHIVFTSWLLHPRCHAIVTEIIETENEIEVIRLTYRDGVVEERFPFEKPIYKVVANWIGGNYVVYTPENADGIIRRSRSMIGQVNLVYNSWSNDCKDFARWCKTGSAPVGWGDVYNI